MGEGIERLKAWARALKHDVVALWLSARDPRTPLAAKLLKEFRAAATARERPRSLLGAMAIGALCVALCALLAWLWLR